MSPQTIRVGVVHDNFLARAGLTATFAACSDMAVQALHPHEEEVLQCSVVVADLQGGMRILDALQGMPQSRRPRIAIVSSSHGEREIRDALQRGAAAYVVQGASGDELVAAVRTICEGGCHLSPSISARLAESLSAENLTVREDEVLALVVDGLCNKRIAARLDISIGTVKTHLRSAFSKLGVHSRTEAIATARRRGILRPANRPAEAGLHRGGPGAANDGARPRAPVAGPVGHHLAAR